MIVRTLSVLAVLVTCCHAVTVSSGDTVIAQIATGGTWKTSIQLLNMGARPAQYTINFYASPELLPACRVPRKRLLVCRELVARGGHGLVDGCVAALRQAN